MLRSGILCLAVFLTACIAVGLSQESAESNESGGQGEGLRGGNGGSAEEIENEAGQPAPGIPLPPISPFPPGFPLGDVNPHDLTGRRLQRFLNRLNIVRQKLSTLASTIARYLYFGREEAAILKEALLGALEDALFSLPEQPIDEPFLPGIPF